MIQALQHYSDLDKKILFHIFFRKSCKYPSSQKQTRLSRPQLQLRWTTDMFGECACALVSKLDKMKGMKIKKTFDMVHTFNVIDKLSLQGNIIS